MKSYDLHCHSTASDGSCRPEELIPLAQERGLDCLALTDHDTLSGIKVAQAAAENSNVRLIPGVEISVSWDTVTVHILGLGVDLDNEALNTGLTGLCEFREHRAREIDRLMTEAGVPGLYEECAELAVGNLISRTHFAQAMINRGIVKDMRQAFKKYFVKNKPGYVPGVWAKLDEAVSWIIGAGGLAVIAHPARYQLSAGKLRKLIEEFKDLGGIGLEVVSGSHSDQDCIRMADYARRYELAASAGSDFHGLHHPWRQLGQLRALPKDLQPVWQHPAWFEKKSA